VIELYASLRYSGSYKISSLSQIYQLPVPGATKSSAQVTFRPNTGWYVQGYIHNIENKILPVSAIFGAFSAVQLSDPRTMGIRAGWAF
jgi:hypothetical protein